MIVRSRLRSSSSRSSASLVAVTSRVTPKVPTIRPVASRQGIFVDEAQPLRPSRMMSRSNWEMIGLPVRMISCSSRNACSACSREKKSMSDLPTHASGEGAPSERAWAALFRTNRLSRSLK